MKTNDRSHVEVKYSDQELKTFRKDPEALHKHRLEVEDALAGFVTPDVMTFGTFVQKSFAELFKKHMSESRRKNLMS